VATYFAQGATKVKGHGVFPGRARAGWRRRI